MKRTLIMLPLALFFLVSCQPDPISYVSYHSNAANFYIENLSTGEIVRNGGMVTHIEPDTIWVAPNNINAHPNDVIKLYYLPPKKYENSVYSVSFSASGMGWFWNFSISGNTAYEEEITLSKHLAGVYTFNCDAKANEWLQGSSDYGILQLTIIENE